jgi:hypothetical protein
MVGGGTGAVDAGAGLVVGVVVVGGTVAVGLGFGLAVVVVGRAVVEVVASTPGRAALASTLGSSPQGPPETMTTRASATATTIAPMPTTTRRFAQLAQLAQRARPRPP